MNKKFTPGPWKVVEAVTGEQWIANEGAAEDGGDVVCMMPDKNMSASRRRWPANSAIICAAPEMFEWLEFFAQGPELDTQTTDKLKQLLTKITTP